MNKSSSFYGWDFAKEQDTTSLIQRYFSGVVLSPGYNPIVDEATKFKVEGFVNLFGDTAALYHRIIYGYQITEDYSGYSWAYAATDAGGWASFSVGNHDYYDLAGQHVYNNFQDSVKLPSAISWSPTGEYGGTPAEGFALVRSAIPVSEPTTLALFGFALLRLRAERRKSRS